MPTSTDATTLTQCHLLDTGCCTASEHHLIQGGRRQRVVVHSVAALLRHPTQGWLLWDAGYAPRLLDATRRLPFRLYRWVTPMTCRPEQAVVAQLGRFGLAPRDVRRVVVSHFHADHVAGLRDFPTADLIALRSAYEDVAGRRGLRALAVAYVPALMPDDFDRRATLLPPFAGPALGRWGRRTTCSATARPCWWSCPATPAARWGCWRGRRAAASSSPPTASGSAPPTANAGRRTA